MDQSTTTDSDESNDNAYQTCRVLQYMIDTNAKRLDGIRTQCSATEEITRQEIRELESKLVKLFCKQLIAKSRLKEDNLRDKLKDIPSLVNWLSVVGVEHVLQETLTSNGMTFESLLEMTNEELDNMLTRYRASSENIHDLQVANDSIRKWTQMELNGEDMTVSASDIDLAWTLYTSPPSCATSNSSSSSPRIGRPSTSSLPPDVATSPMSPHTRPDTPQSPLVNNNSGISTGTDSTQSTPTEPFHHIHHTNIPLGPTISNPIYSSNTPAVPPPSPGGRRHTPPAISGQHVQASSKGKFPTTPPPQKRNKLYPEGFLHPLTKSVSHESQLSVKVNNSTTSIPDTTDRLQKPDNLTLLGSSDSFYKRRHSTEDSAHRIESRMDGHATIASSSTTSSALLSPRHYTDRSMPMHPPLSPKTPVGSRSMMHSISHRFHTKLVMGACDLCAKHVLIGRMCKFCKAKFHKDCANKAAPACGLPKEYVDLVIEMIKDGTGQQRRVSNHNTLPVGSNLGGDLRQTASVPAFQTAGSGSNTSSCHSSSPSSPALHIANLSMSNHNHIQSHNSPAIQVYNETGSSLFKFPDLSNVSSIDGLSTVSTDTAYNSDMVNTTTSNDSDKSDRTLVDSDGTGVQGATLEQPRYAYLDRVDSTDSACEDRTWSRINSISVTLKEWDIPYEELKLGDRIGTGRFGTVYKGNWHGDVAIKMLNMDPEQDNQTQLQAFKLEVAMLRKTRHENLVLFMGACMKPPDLAIITSLCKGQTLYTHIHVRREKFQLNRSVIIASQISQGMGYLHAKGIVHKDLKTKNIFLESGKVVITDFGLFNVTKLCHGNRKGQWLSIPQGWLCYLSPEIMHCLTSTHTQHQLPFSEASDVYAFGTVWYEMLCGEWPFKGLPAEPVIWQVGKGIKQSLANVRTSRDIKEVLMMCWSYKKEDRPDFSQLLKTLERLPKKRLARSPSHPIQLSRSAESVF